MKRSARAFGLLCFFLLSFSYAVRSDNQTESTTASQSRRSFFPFFKKPAAASQKPADGVPVHTEAPVLVSASRLPSFKQKPEDFPANLSIKSSRDVTAAHPAAFQDIVKDLEGIHIFDQTGNGFDEVFTLRGFVEGGDTVFLLDGVRVNEVDGFSVLLPLIRTNNVESVEIARGSSSAIYGTGAFAGVVNIKTKQASKKPFSFFGGNDWTSFRGVRFYNGVSGTLEDGLSGVGGKMTYYFNMSRDQKRGFRSNGEYRDTSLDFKVGYELPDDEGGIRFGLKTVDDAISNPGALTLAEYQNDYSQSQQLLDGRKMENKILYVNVNKWFLDHRLNASLQSSVRRRTSRFYTTSRTFTDFTDGFNPDTDLVTTRSHEKNYIGQLAYQDSWKWLRSESLGGLEFTRGMSHDKRQDAFRGNVVERTAVETLRSGETSAFGIFGHERVHLGEKLTGEFGIRGSYHWVAIVDDRLNGHANDFNRHWRDLSLSTGAVAKPFRWWHFFFGYSQAFRVPQFSDINSFGGDASANLSPETAETFEVGTRLMHRDAYKVKLSYFEIITHDEIFFDSSATSTTNQFGRNINIGRSRRNGVELRVDAQLLKELAAYGTYTLTRAIVRETVPDPDTSAVSFAHRFIGQVPENRYTFGLDAQPLKRLGAPYDGFRVLLNAIFVGRQHVQSFESTGTSFVTGNNLLNQLGGMIKPYNVWDLKLSYEWRSKEIFLKVNNLFDQRYYPRAVISSTFGTASVPVAGDYLFVTPGAPREFVVGLRYEFG